MADKFELTDATPPPAPGKANVKWQSDTNGNISAYVDPVIGPQGPQGEPGPAGPQGLPLAVQDEGTPRTQRAALNFVGSAVAATDDAANNRTNVTITAQAQTPWVANIDAAGFSLNGAGYVNSAAAAVNPNATGAGVIIREAQRGGWIGSADNAPRLTFQWNGAATSQIGIDSGGNVRTFDFAGTGYIPFAAAQIESKSGGFKFPDSTIQTTAWSANASINAQTGTSYTLVAGDNGKIITMSNAAAITLTVPAGLGSGFSCLIVQLGAGKVTVASSGVTVVQRQSFTKTAGQYAVASLLAYAANVFALSGDLGT